MSRLLKAVRNCWVAASRPSSPCCTAVAAEPKNRTNVTALKRWSTAP
jgi:hypothetical protein